jgi:hypothetical protein
MNIAQIEAILIIGLLLEVYFQDNLNDFALIHINRKKIALVVDVLDLFMRFPYVRKTEFGRRWSDSNSAS